MLIIVLFLCGAAWALSAREDADIRSHCANTVCSKERKSSMRACLKQCYAQKKSLPSKRVIPQVRHPVRKNIANPMQTFLQRHLRKPKPKK